MFTAALEAGYCRPTSVDSSRSGSVVTPIEPIPEDTLTITGFSDRASSGTNACVTRTSPTTLVAKTVSTSAGRDLGHGHHRRPRSPRC